MPAETKEAARTVPGRRWLSSAIKAASEPLPALPFDRANRIRPASFTPPGSPRKGAIAAN